MLPKNEWQYRPRPSIKIYQRACADVTNQHQSHSLRNAGHYTVRDKYYITFCGIFSDRQIQVAFYAKHDGCAAAAVWEDDHVTGTW